MTDEFKNFLNETTALFGRPLYYALDDEGEPVALEDALEFGQWFADSEKRRVALTTLTSPDGQDTIDISTVFLGLDHNWRHEGPPVLWETMVFGGPLDGEMDRYDSRTKAVAGHNYMVWRVENAVDWPV